MCDLIALRGGGEFDQRGLMDEDRSTRTFARWCCYQSGLTLLMRMLLLQIIPLLLLPLAIELSSYNPDCWCDFSWKWQIDRLLCCCIRIIVVVDCQLPVSLLLFRYRWFELLSSTADAPVVAGHGPILGVSKSSAARKKCSNFLPLNTSYRVGLNRWVPILRLNVLDTYPTFFFPNLFAC